jgi:hypothetical protein
MGKKRRILIAALLVCLLGGFACWLLRPREPSYQGKSSSVWLEDYSPPSQGTFEADEALRHIGTNAIATLLQMLRATDSPLKIKCLNVLARQHLVEIKPALAWEKDYEACLGFRALGESASNAMPELLQIYAEKISPASQCQTAGAIGRIGPAATAAIPSLLQGLKSTNNPVRWNTVRALGWIHGQPETVVPALMEHLQDSNLDICGTSAEALGAFGTNARVAIPILVQKINAPGWRSPYMRNSVANALKQIDPDAAAKAGVK